MEDEQLGLTLMWVGVLAWDLGMKIVRGIKVSRQVVGVAIEMCAAELQEVANRLKEEA